MKTVKKVVNIIRLGAFPIAYGLTGALVSGTLNRVMIADIGLPASLVGFFFAIPLLVSPARTWLGYRSDAYPLMGRRREPYMLLGAIALTIGLILATMITVRIASLTALLAIGVLLSFVLYGFGRNLAHNSFQALLSDNFKGPQRSRAVTGYEVVTLLGLVAGAGGLGQALETYDPGRLVAVSLGVSAIVVVLTVLAAFGQEKVDEAAEEATETARRTPFGKAMREIVLPDPQVRLFFVLVLLTFIGTLAQDVLLEPYGALVLGMPVGATTRLTAFWGLGVMASMLLAGMFLINLLGYMRVLRIGLIGSIFVFAGVIAVGAVGNPNLFRILVLFMGLGTGLAGAGMLTGVINFTTSIRAGMLLGVWGMANMVGHALGSLMGGGVVDIMLALSNGNALLAYSTVFALEIGFLVTAVVLSLRFNPQTSLAQIEAEVVLPTGVESSALS
jgi:BCD family chlorophyll transporter-like MFS transporter